MATGSAAAPIDASFNHVPAASNLETPETKQSFDWIYEEPDPVAYKTDILDLRTYICDNFTRKEFDRVLLPKVQALAQKKEGGVQILDLGSCFGNTTLAVCHGMTTDEIRLNWADKKVCENIQIPRRFPCSVTGIDLSASALNYCLRSGICDEIIPANLNTPDGLSKCLPIMRKADLLISTATLVYLNVESAEVLIKEFASGEGEGYAIVNFLNPFELDKTDAMKRILLENLDFIGSTSSRHRTLSPKEKANYPDYGDWALLEIWTLKRRANSVNIIGLSAEEDLTAQAYYDSDDADNFYHMIWGGDNLHVGIYDSAAMKVPMGPERIKIASETSLRRLAEQVPPKKGQRVIDMGSAYGGCARYFAKEYGCFVSCVDLSAKENERCRRMTKEAGLEHLVVCPGERSFTATGEPSESFDLVVSEDSFLHAGQYREAAIKESARVLKPGGYLVFTDIMQSDTCNVEAMAPVYKRIQLDDMGSPGKYKEWARKNDMVFVRFENLTEQLPKHYGTVRQVLLGKHESGELKGKVSEEYVANMASGLQSWVDQANNKNLAWGFMVFQKARKSKM